MPGPPPKRDEERRRRNKPDVPTEKVNLDETLAGEVERPVADEGWHDVAKMMYAAAARSGQAIWYEPTDWAAIYLFCESLSRDLEEQVVGITESGDVVRAEIPLKGASLSAYLKLMGQLMLTEGERRKLRVELERKKAVDAALSGDGVVVPITQKRMGRFEQ